MNRTLRTPLTALLAGTLAATPLALTPPASAAPATVSGAELRWAVNHEVNSGAFAPGTWNLMSAGRIGDPGAGGQTLRTADSGATWSNGAAAGWRASSGSVRLDDTQADGTKAPASFQGTRTDAAGVPTNATASSVNAGTELVFGAGSGTLDAATDDATITWDGDATVLLYSGMSFLYLSDPVLEVDAGRATLSAVVGGYATDMNDMSRWSRVADARVTIATARGVDVTDTGLTGAAEYLGVAYDAPSGGTAQSRSGATWGSFPAPFVDYQQRLGSGSYWYSSGGAADPKKPAAPFHVAYTSTPGGTTVTGAAASRTTLTVPGAVRKGRKSAVTVRVSPAAGGGTGAGTVDVVLKRTAAAPGVRGPKAKRGTVMKATRTLRAGRARVGLPRLSAGRYKVVVRYAGDTALRSSRDVSRFRVR